MKRCALIITYAMLMFMKLSAQSNKITGPLGLYHNEDGYTYNDTSGRDSILMEYQFRFGELNIPDQSFDNNFYFGPDVDSCISWNINRVLGILQPPTEHGVYNQPADTLVYNPIPQLDGPGMIQGGQRFSRLSQQHGGFCGVILDDWNGDTAITRQIRDAVKGKTVDAAGNVVSGSTATTPYNKLYCVIYNTAANPGALPVMDGLSYWNFLNQDCCYQSIDSNITQLRNNFPGKEIMVGIYLKNTTLGWTNAAGVQYMLLHALNRYDNGEINGITIFAGIFLMKYYMPLDIWKGFGLTTLLDTAYFPYLGEGQGTAYDCKTGTPIPGTSLHVFCRGRLTNDTLMRSYQQSDETGKYHFGLWAGNRSTDSSYYWLIADKPGYNADTVGFWIRRNDTTVIPALQLCPAPDTVNNTSNLKLFPNPSNGRFTIISGEPRDTEARIEIFNLLGAMIFDMEMPKGNAQIDLSQKENGAYLVLIKTKNKKITQKGLLILQK